MLLIRQNETFGRWVKRRRAGLDLSRDGLAGLIGCATETIRKIERDQRRPSSQIAELLAIHLQVPLEIRPEFVHFARGKTLDELAETSGAHTVLPLSATPLVGREADLEALCKQLQQPHVRLMTLSGPPGVGKTRLAVALATAVKDGFSSGIGYVDLAATRQAVDVIAAIALGLGIKDIENQPTRQTLQHFLRGQSMLLLLDNFEQVVDAAPDLLDLLQNAPRLKLLVTSRVTLNVSAEHLYIVSPLNLMHAVALFALRAQAVQPGFQLTAGNTIAVDTICRRLDGLPLAIELAASRLRIFTPHTLLDNLDLDITALHGQHDLPGRQQTLRDAISWSYDLLDDDFQAVFRQLSVFAGGCTLEAAAVVCNLSQEDMIDALIALLDASLIQLTKRGNNERYFNMLALVREFALEQLIGAGAEHAISQRHAAYFLQQAQSAEPEWMTNARTQWMDDFSAGHDNLRAALAWFQQNQPIGLVQMAGALMWFWRNIGSWHEGRAWLKKANQIARDLNLHQEHPAACARAIQAEGVLAWQQCNLSDAQDLLAQALEQYQRLEMSTDGAYTLVWSGIVAAGSGRSDEAQQYFQQSLALFEDTQDQRGLAFALTWFSSVQMRFGKLAEGRASIQKAHTIWRVLEDDWGQASSSLMLGALALFQNDFSSAEAHLSRGLPFAERAGDAETLHAIEGSLAYVQLCAGNLTLAEQVLQPALIFSTTQGTDLMAISIAMVMAGTIARELGKVEDALHYFTDCLRLHRNSQNDPCIFWCLNGLASVNLAQQPGRAILLWSAAEAYRPEPLLNLFGMSLSAYERQLYERDVQKVAILRQKYDAEWRAGQQLPLADLLDDLPEIT